MKKIILNSLLGVMLCGSVFAETPAWEDRMRNCEKHPDKYVWVQKNRTCVPINACVSKIDAIRDSYCIDGVGPYEKMHEVVEKYAQQILKTNVVKTITGNKLAPDVVLSSGYGNVNAVLADGGYVNFRIIYKNFEDYIAPMYIQGACWAYGFDLSDCDFTYDKKQSSGFGEKCGCYEFKAGQPKCSDIADFASLLKDDVCVGKYDDKEHWCEIRCNKQEKVLSR